MDIPAGVRQVLSEEECHKVCVCLNEVIEEHPRPCVGWFVGMCIGACIFIGLLTFAEERLYAQLQRVCAELTERFAARDITFTFFRGNILRMNAALPEVSPPPLVRMVNPLLEGPYYVAPLVYGQPA